MVPRMLSQFRSGDPEGCRGLCPRVVPPGFRVSQGTALTAVLGIEVFSPVTPSPVSRSPNRAPAGSALRMGHPPRYDRRAGWLASDRRCRRPPERVLGQRVWAPEDWKTVGGCGLVAKRENVKSSLFSYHSSQLLFRSVAFLLPAQM